MKASVSRKEKKGQRQPMYLLGDLQKLSCQVAETFDNTSRLSPIK